MNPDDLAKILDELGQRLGPTGEHVFALAVRQVYIDSFIGLVAGTVALVGVTVATIYAARVTKSMWAADVAKHANDRYGSADPFGYCMAWLLGGAFLAVAGFCGFLLLAGALSGFLNPEYAAIRDILHAVTGGKS